MLDREAAFRQLVLGETRGMRANVLRLALRPLALPYRLVTSMRNLAYDRGWLTSHGVSVPVLCVGNLTVGGTGKTPMVEYFARRFLQNGLRVALLSRGYGSKAGPNDEAMILEENLPGLPHLQGRDRVQLAQFAVSQLHSQLLLLDDGFQHRRLRRDRDVVLIDATAPFGGGRVLPAGLLRESVHALRRASLVILTRCDAVPDEEKEQIRGMVHRINPHLPWVQVRFAPSSLRQSDGEELPLRELAGKRVYAFSGIGNPQPFFDSLRRLDACLVQTRVFPDHHTYAPTDVTSLAQEVADSKAELAVTTQKDLVKLRIVRLGDTPLYSLRIAPVVEQGIEQIDTVVSQLTTQAISQSTGR